MTTWQGPGSDPEPPAPQPPGPGPEPELLGFSFSKENEASGGGGALGALGLISIFIDVVGGLCEVLPLTVFLHVRWRKKDVVGEYTRSVVRLCTANSHSALSFWLFAYALERQDLRRFRLMAYLRCARLGRRDAMSKII